MYDARPHFLDVMLPTPRRPDASKRRDRARTSASSYGYLSRPVASSRAAGCGGAFLFPCAICVPSPDPAFRSDGFRSLAGLVLSGIGFDVAPVAGGYDANDPSSIEGSIGSEREVMAFLRHGGNDLARIGRIQRDY